MNYRLSVFALLTGLALRAQIPDFTPPTPLFHAILRNDAGAVEKLLAEGAKPDEGRFIGSTPLLIAAVNANGAAIRALLARGADPRAVDRHGSTVLMWASAAEPVDPALLRELVERGADPNTENKMGESALTWARRRGDMATVELLQSLGATDAKEIRRAVENAVALMQKSGPQFVKVSGCVSCHHQSLPQMTNAVARDRGFKVDGAVSEQQVKAVMAMFRPIREQMEKGSITLPNPGISVGYSLLGLAAEGYAPDATTAAMIRTIERTQLPDGRFGVLAARPPMEASAFTATALGIRALQLYGGEQEDRIARARAWLRDARPQSQEDRSMKLLGLAWAQADPADVEAAAKDVMAKQNPVDGGWAQLEGLESDAYATGQALVALHTAGMLSPKDRAWRHATAFLLRTQFADGSWVVRTRSSPVQPLTDSGFPHGRHQWISATATGWAAMALALSQPKPTTLSEHRAHVGF